MRIAVFHNLPSGGAKRSLFEAVSRLSARHRIDVFSLASADHDFADLRPLASAHRIFRFSPLPLLASPFGRINNAARIIDLARLRRIGRSVARMVEQSPYDVLFAQPCRYENSPSIIRGLRRLPVVFYCHEPLRVLYEHPPPRPYLEERAAVRRLLDGIDPLPGLHRSLLRRRDRGNIRGADCVLVNSGFTRETVKRAYGVESQVCYHGVDTRKFRPAPGGEARRALLSVGSLTPLKGFDFLIRALSRIPAAKRPPLKIASNFQNPPERRFLEQLALELQVDLELLNCISDESLVECYNSAAVVVYAPVREPFGLVPLEAMACGVPVVAVREGGVPESIVHEQTGLLVERDVNRFASAVEQLLDNPALALEYGRNAREHVERHWTWDRAVTALEARLRSCAGRETGGAGTPATPEDAS